MPAYLYEIPTRTYREERNWATEREARTALKHVARRAVQAGAATEDLLLLIEVKTSTKLFEGTIGAALKP
jgi:hypothetical protein